MEANNTVIDIEKSQHKSLINLEPDREESFCFSQSNRILFNDKA